MTVESFKGIFWWEYIHRLLGRAIGVAFLVPFLYFLARGRVRGTLAWKLGAIFLVGGLQGAMGGYMVKSGLVDDPRVSQFRLAAHLGRAFLIFGALLWVALDLLRGERGVVPAPLKKLCAAFAGIVFVTVLAGALVAGIRAGYAYNTFPLMNGHFVPPEVFMIEPWWKNFGYNMATVQFDHRALAWLVLALTAYLWVRARAAGKAVRCWSNALAAAVATQFALGVATVLSVVHIVPAALHQAVSVIVFACAIGLAHAAARGS
jgi:cytochrome c oxidase assembly protein subunit 15